MQLYVGWSNGIVVRYRETRLLLDPTESDPAIEHVLVSHAHYDHSKGLEFLIQNKYSTAETLDIYNAVTGRKATKWQQIRYGRRVKVGDLEVEAHNAGHILGSAQYEIVSPEGSLVYTGDLNLVDTLTTKAADIVPCDILVIESTFGSPGLVHPPRETVASEIVKWSIESLRNLRIPALQTDSIGNAQELVRLYNTWTQIPVVVHPRIGRVNRVYEKYGMALSYINSNSEEAQKLLGDFNCVVIAPKRIGLHQYPEFNVGYVSGWAALMGEGDRKPFPLSDHADFQQLTEYVMEAKPRLVLTCFGGRFDKTFADYISRRLGVKAKPLSIGGEGMPPLPRGIDEGRVEACRKEILEYVKIPGFVYEKRAILSRLLTKGFKEGEINGALLRLTRAGVLRYLHAAEAYTLRPMEA